MELLPSRFSSGVGFGQFVLGLNWIATAFTYQAAMPAWLGWIAILLLSLYLAVYPAVAAGLAWRWGRERPLPYVLLFAAAWIVAEWLRATMFTGFAWNPAGIVLLATPLSRLATLIGTYGLSGIVTLVRLVTPLNARSRMLVTGRPTIVPGMLTAPPVPVYPVMVITPLALDHTKPSEVVPLAPCAAEPNTVKKATQAARSVERIAFMR